MNLQTLRATRSKAQQTVWHCVIEYWQQFIQALSGSKRGIYDGIKRAVEPVQSKMASPCHQLAKFFPMRTNRWGDGLNTTQTWTQHKTQLLPTHLTPWNTDQPLMSLMQNQQKITFLKEKLVELMGLLLDLVKPCQNSLLLPLRASALKKGES